MSLQDSNRFRKEERLGLRNDFRRVYHRKCSVSDEWLIIYSCENELDHLRIGLSVSKKKFPKATDRNRVRRLYREGFRLSKQELPGGMDLIFIPRTSSEPKLEQIENSLRNLVPKAAKRLAKKA